MTKKKSITYFLWLFGGLFGAHHFYLGRDRSTFIWFSSFGGFFVGLLRDLFKIPEYLRDINGEEDFEKSLSVKKKLMKAPSFESSRFFGSLVISALYGYLIQYSIPQDYEETRIGFFLLFKYLLAPLGSAIGSFLVNTEGHVKCDFKWTLFGAYLGVVPLFLGNPFGMSYSGICATLASNWTLKWRQKKPQQKSIKKRMFTLGLSAALYTSVVISCLLFNANVTVNGEKSKLIDSIKNFFQSKAWLDLSAFLTRLWHIYRLYGWDKLKEEFVNGADIQGLKRAYETLGLDESVSQEQLDLECKKLSRKWHPDRYKSEDEKINAQNTFMNIQEACNRVSKHRRDKFIKNQQDEL